MRRRMENDLRAVSAEHVVDLAGVSHAGDQDKKIEIGVVAEKFLLNVVRVVFVNIENDKLFRSVGGDLPAKFAADRSAAARHENDFVFDVAHDLVEIDGNLFSAEKVADIDFSEIFHRKLTVCDLIDPRKDFDRFACVFTAGDDLAQPFFVYGRHGNEDLVHPIDPGVFFNVVSRSGNLHVTDRFSEFFVVVVHHAYGFIGNFIGSLQLSDNGKPRFAAAYDHNAFLVFVVPTSGIQENSYDPFGKAGNARQVKEKSAVHESRSDAVIASVRDRGENDVHETECDDGKAEFYRVDNADGRKDDRVKPDSGEAGDGDENVSLRYRDEFGRESRVVRRGEIREQHGYDDGKRVRNDEESQSPYFITFPFHDFLPP